jgi:hypothetical protein
LEDTRELEVDFWNCGVAIMPVIIYQRQHGGESGAGSDQWFSAGARPILFFSDYASLW